MALIMFALSTTAYEKIGVKMCMTVMVTFRMGQGEI